MKKESIGRLLLTLLTAFVMVAGVFGAANQTWTDTQSDDRTDQVADSDPDMEIRDVGDAPASAKLVDARTAGEQSPIRDDAMEKEDNVVTDSIELMYPDGDSNDWTEPESQGLVEAHGTRAAEVDAGGPYGELPPGMPYYEGETVDFEGDIIGGSNSDYYFRWEVTGDGEYDVNHFPAAYGGDGIKGEADYTHEYRDNIIGDVTLEAWDGISTQPGPDANMLDELYYSGSYWVPVPRFYQNPPPNGRDGTWGLQFDVYKDCTVDQLGYFSTYAPSRFYNARLWEMSTQTCIGVNFATSNTPTYQWKWVSIKDPANPFGPDITVDLEAGKSYMVTTHMYYSDGRFPRNTNPGMTSDGVMEPINSWFNYGGDSYPTNLRASSIIVLMDVNYKIPEPLILSDTASVVVDNIAPVAQNPVAIGEPGLEGSEIGFTAEFYDIGLDDDWWYMWHWGDGTSSDWIPVNKWSGGGRVLMATTWSASQESIGTALANELGNWLVQLDYHNWYDIGSPPDLDLMLQYDVVIVGTNYIPSSAEAEAMGDRLAEYVDAGGNVVQFWSSFHTSDRITGRWVDEDYQTIVRGSLNSGSQTLGTVYDPTHPIMDGVSSLSSYYKHNSYSVTPYATRLADYNTGRVLAAYNDMNHPNGPTSRIVGLPMFPSSGNVGGDAWTMIANAVKWASQQPDPVQLPMPITLETAYHVYADDHPTTLTSEDIMDVSVEVKDDDHDRTVRGGGAQGIVINEVDTNVDAIELYNYGPDQDMTGWVQYNDEYPSQGLHTYNFPNGFVLKSGAFVHLHENGNPANDDDDDLYMPGNVYWNVNGPASCVSLVDDSGNCVDYVPWNGYESSPNPAVPIEPWTGSIVQNGNDNIFRITDIDTDDAGDWGLGPYSGATWKALNPGQTGMGPSGEDPWEYTFYGISDPVYTTALIQNVFPYATFPDTLPDIINEQTPTLFEEIQVEDIAYGSGTEELWYRIDKDDGTGVGPWNPVTTGGGGKLNVLIYHSFDANDVNAQAFRDNLLPYLPVGSTADIWNFYDGASGPAPLSVLEMYDVVFVGIQLAPFDGDAVGDGLADYVDGGGAVVETSAAFDGVIGWWGIGGRWRTEEYQTLQSSMSILFGLTATILDPSHPIANGPAGTVTTFNGGISSGCPGVTSSSTLLAQSGSYAMAAYHNDYQIAGLNVLYYPGYYGTPETILVANALMYVASGLKQPIPAFELTYQDNGIYYFDVQTIDDDMWWDLTGPQPVFVGPNNDPNNPGADPADWISHSIHPIEVYNTDPVISAEIKAYAEVDLSIRTTGQPLEDVEMRLYKGTTMIGSVICHHDGNEKIKVLSGHAFDMTEINDYHVEVEYFGTGGGATPTWIFSGHFPSGKVKELKHEFKDGDPVWIIGADMLRDMIRGEDIIFEATAYDIGSDDLAFVWNFGDTTPMGVHIYANANPSVHVGVSDEATVIFDQDPDREPWFDKSANTERSADGTPILITDTIIHRFDESQAEYFYVALTVMDDDVKDDYPSAQHSLAPGMDSDCVEIDLR